MMPRTRWAIFLAATAALFALVAALLLFLAWMFAEAFANNAPFPWRVAGLLLGVFFAPAWITAIFAFWHWRRWVKTGRRSAMVETGVSFISGVSIFFAASLFLAGG